MDDKKVYYLITDEELKTFLDYFGEVKLKDSLNYWILITQQIAKRRYEPTQESKTVIEEK